MESNFNDVRNIPSRYGQEFTATTTQVLNSDGALILRGDDGVTLDASAGSTGISIVPGSGKLQLSGTTTLGALTSSAFPATSTTASTSVYDLVETGTVDVANNLTTGTLNMTPLSAAISIGASQTGGETIDVGGAGTTTVFAGDLVANDPDVVGAGSTAQLWDNL